MNKIKNSPFFKLLSRLSVLIILFVVLALTTHNFIKLSNLTTILLQVAIYAVIAYGVTFVLIVGATDLSAGSVVGLAGIVSALLLRDYAVSPVMAIIAGLITGAVCGFLNGVCITYLKIIPFVATLGTSWIFRGVCQLIGDGQPVTIRSSENPTAAEFLKVLGSGRIGGFPVAAIVFIILGLALSVILSKTVLGRNIYATGSNQESARLSGINVRRTTIYAFIVCDVLAALGGVLITARLSSGQVSAGTGYELEGIAAAVIGGVSLMGGEGSIAGALIGALIMGMLRNGLNLNGINSYWQQIVIGAVLIFAVAFDLFQRRKVGT
ncbi:ABC transporter permease [bacterium 1XD21-13]|nr:ABC transporter permease [bacterium 1XD21-13]